MEGKIIKNKQGIWTVEVKNEKSGKSNFYPVNPYQQEEEYQEGEIVKFNLEEFWETGIEKTFKVANIGEEESSTQELDAFHYHEVLDRLTLLGDSLERHLIDHPVCEAHPELKEILLKSQETIIEAYLKVGEIISSSEETEDHEIKDK
jgi:hypothetical protein